MTPEQIEKERQAFEAWMLEDFGTDSIERDPSNTNYVYGEVSDKWDGWLACAEISILREDHECNKSYLAGMRQGWEYGLDVRDEEYMIRKQELQNEISESGKRLTK